MSAIKGGSSKRYGGSKQRIDENYATPPSTVKRRFGSIVDPKLARTNLIDKFDLSGDQLEKAGSSFRDIKPPHRIPKILQAATASIADIKQGISLATSPTREFLDAQVEPSSP